ncbi:MAG TPA: gamma-glutamyltransferase family protein [Methylomirabilota bacterium]|nr:gamma-glutamyltransferase family protein [Methylomirabilota bacterium]
MTAESVPQPHETCATTFGLRPVALGRRGMVASANPLATLAGVRMLARGGNAVDAVVAAAAALGVVEPYMSGLAGCGIAVLTRPGHRPRVLNFLGRAPAGATPERLAAGNHTFGPLSVAVPGNLAGWARLLADHGTLGLGDVLEPAIETAEAGPPLTPFDRQMFDEHVGHLDPEAARTYLHDGRTPTVGAPLRQPALAASFRRIAREGIQAVYGGALGDAIVGALGGVMTREDLAGYPGRLAWADPLRTTYRGVEVFVPAPPSSAIQMLETLNGLSGWELGALPHLGPDHLATIAEAARVARMDTHRHVGDPDHHPVPVDQLLGPAHTEALRAEMRARLGARRPAAAVAGGSTGAAGEASTTHLAAVDASGLAVNVTQSLGHGFGSGVVAPGTGICLNNALHWTSTDPGHPNVVAPGKRHEWPIAPAQLFRDGEFWATVGTPGSYGILVTTVQVIANLVDFRLNVQDAVAAPRFRWLDEAIDPLPAETLRIESRVPEATRRALAARGYALEPLGAWSMRVGGAQAIVRDRATGWLMGGADPRRNGYAMGW